MPTYAYACTECGHRFEAVQAFTDSSLTECPECAGKLRKLFSSVGIVFKGSGFYRTDSRKAAATAEAGSGGSTGSGSKESKESKESSPSTSSTSAGTDSSSSSSTKGTTTPAKAAS